MTLRTRNRLIRTVKSFALVAALPLMVMGLLAPVIGPTLDHHYADRSPVHAHAFTGQDDIDHSHSIRDHGHADETFGNGVSVVSTSVSSADCPLNLDGTTLEYSVQNNDHHLTALFVGESPVPDEEAITPFVRPPRHS